MKLNCYYFYWPTCNEMLHQEQIIYDKLVTGQYNKVVGHVLLQIVTFLYSVVMISCWL